MVSSMCGNALMRSTNTIVPCLQSSMVVVASWSGDAWLLLVLGSCGSLRETWILTCTVTFWSRRWCPPFRNCFPTKQPPQTHRQDYNCLAAEGKGDGVAKYVSRPETYWAHVGHPQAEGGEAPCLTSSSSVMSLFMEEWKRMPSTTCPALVNSIPRRIKAVLDNNGAPTKYWHFRHSFDVFT